MTDREKISHLLRRLGLGAGELELQTYLPLGVDGTIDRLINYDNVESGLLMQPYQLTVDKQGAVPNLDTALISIWWYFRMWATLRPLEEKLALFWHSRIPIGGDKVDYAPLAVEYMQCLYQNELGRFADILNEISMTSAMLKYLDGDESISHRPNENFAREVMELFTLGIGNYTEQDVMGAKRVFTGYGLRYPVFEDNTEKYEVRMPRYINQGIPLVGGYWSMALHDQGVKTVLGKSGRFTPKDFIEILSKEDATAKRIGTKMFEFFAYDSPEAKIQDHMADVFKKNDGNTRAILTEIVHMDEFWSDKCVGQKYKSPIDFTLAILRQTGFGPYLRAAQNPGGPLNAIDQKLRGGMYYVMTQTQKQGLMLLYPPNVKGWNWGPDWVTAGAMAQRIKLGTDLFWFGDPKKRLGNSIAAAILAKKPADSQEFVEGFLRIFDADAVSNRMKLLVEAFDKAGGLATLANPDAAPAPVAAIGRMAFGAPEFQFC